MHVNPDHTLEGWNQTTAFNANSFGHGFCSLTTMPCLVLYNSTCMYQLDRQHNASSSSAINQQHRRKDHSASSCLQLITLIGAPIMTFDELFGAIFGVS